MPPSTPVVFGDSFNWGQGLLPEHTFSTLVRGAIDYIAAVLRGPGPAR